LRKLEWISNTVKILGSSEVSAVCKTIPDTAVGEQVNLMCSFCSQVFKISEENL
jgi:hypothetical protein